MGNFEQSTATEATAKCPKHGDYTSRRIAVPTFGNSKSLDVWTKCPKCAEDEAEQEKIERAKQAQHRYEQKLKQAGIPRRFANRTLDGYIVSNPRQARALHVASEFAQNFAHHAAVGSVLVFSGNVGTGKGHLATAIAQRVLELGNTAMFATAREIVLMMRASWHDKNAPSESEVVKTLTAVDLLVIDEIGVQFGSDAERDQLFAVIDGRYRDMRPMILTTNLGTTKLCETIGERSYSRLREDGRWVTFDWEDHRATAKTTV